MGTSHVRRSHGVDFAPFSDGAIAFDAVTDQLHLLGTVAARLLLNDEPTPLDAVIDDETTASGKARIEVESEIAAGVESMCSLGLLDRREPFWVPGPVSGSTGDGHGRLTGCNHVIHDRCIVFRSSERSLLDEIDAYLGTAIESQAEAVAFDVEPGADGRVHLQAAEEWDFSSRDNFLAQLPGMLNDFAARSHTLAVLHAGAVRTPTGRLLLISGAAESGKSTLVGALVQRGCDYLGDEMIGIRSGPLEAVPYPKPLELDEASCDVLDAKQEIPPYIRPHELRPGVTSLTNPAGPIDEVVFPSFHPGADTEVVRLSPDGAVKALLGQTLNLRRVREPGLRAICELAETVPVSQVIHGDSVGLAETLMERTAPLLP